MKNPFSRARKPEEIEQRRSQLLATARLMLESNQDIHDLSLNELARRAKMAKSNVYRYFETREALLLALLWEEWNSWFEETRLTLGQKGRRKIPASKTLKHIAKTLSERQLLCALTSALPSVVERNLSEETIREFKLASLDFFKKAGAFFENCSEGLTAEEYTQLLYDSACLITGFYPLAHPTKMVERVLKDPGLKFFRRDLRTDLYRMLAALLKSR